MDTGGEAGTTGTITARATTGTGASSTTTSGTTIDAGIASEEGPLWRHRGVEFFVHVDLSRSPTVNTCILRLVHMALWYGLGRLHTHSACRCGCLDGDGVLDR